MPHFEFSTRILTGLGRSSRTAMTLGLALAFGSASAVTLTDLAFTSNVGGQPSTFINDTIVNGTSPLGFTAPALGAAFLNNPDSTISLGFGNYFAYNFTGFGQHVGNGTISGKNDGVAFSSSVVFPSDITTPGDFFNFTFGNGETIRVGVTGLTADRIQIASDGSGLSPGGNVDVPYSFNYAAGVSAVPEPGTWGLMLGGLGLIGAFGRRRSR